MVGRLPSGAELGRTKIIVPGNEADSSVRKAARELRVGGWVAAWVALHPCVLLPGDG